MNKQYSTLPPDDAIRVFLLGLLFAVARGLVPAMVDLAHHDKIDGEWVHIAL
jgi:hypothetical protein